MTPVFQYLEDQQSRFIDSLCEYVRFPSVSAQPQHASDLRAAAQWIAERARSLTLETTIHETEGNPIVVARTPKQDPKKPTFLVYGHYDVQPPEPFARRSNRASRTGTSTPGDRPTTRDSTWRT